MSDYDVIQTLAGQDGVEGSTDGLGAQASMRYHILPTLPSSSGRLFQKQNFVRGWTVEGTSSCTQSMIADQKVPSGGVLFLGKLDALVFLLFQILTLPHPRLAPYIQQIQIKHSTTEPYPLKSD